jgi:hypothetical protein
MHSPVPGVLNLGRPSVFIFFGDVSSSDYIESSGNMISE